MTRMIGYFANQTDRIQCALTNESDAINFGAERVDGWGVGSYQFGEVLMRKRPTDPREAVKLLDVVRDLRTGCMLAHVRTATVGARSLDNTHPFRHHQWLFAHAGTLPRFSEVRRALLDEIPEHLARSVRGDTDSEVLFYLFLSAVNRTGHLDDPDLDRAGVMAALGEAADVVDRVCGPDGGLNLLVTNGRTLVALRRGAPMSWARRNGLRDCPVCRKAPEITGREPRRVDHESLRYVVIAGDSAATASGWHEVPASPRGTFLAVDRALEAQVTAR
jgi:glutamine amidotransferase